MARNHHKKKVPESVECTDSSSGSTRRKGNTTDGAWNFDRKVPPNLRLLADGEDKHQVTKGSKCEPIRSPGNQHNNGTIPEVFHGPEWSRTSGHSLTVPRNCALHCWFVRVWLMRFGHGMSWVPEYTVLSMIFAACKQPRQNMLIPEMFNQPHYHTMLKPLCQPESLTYHGVQVILLLQTWRNDGYPFGLGRLGLQGAEATFNQPQNSHMLDRSVAIGCSSKETKDKKNRKGF